MNLRRKILWQLWHLAVSKGETAFAPLEGLKGIDSKPQDVNFKLNELLMEKLILKKESQGLVGVVGVDWANTSATTRRRD